MILISFENPAASVAASPEVEEPNMKKKHSTPLYTVDSKKTGRRIRHLMAAKGLSVRDLQNDLGLSCPQGIYRWLRGDTLPSIDNLYALQGLLGVSAGHILRGSYPLRTPEEIEDAVFYQRVAFAYGAALTAFQLLSRRRGGW